MVSRATVSMLDPDPGLDIFKTSCGGDGGNVLRACSARAKVRACVP